MKKLLPLTSVLIALAARSFAGEPVSLANFDGPPSPWVGMPVQPETTALEGSQAGTFRNEGFKPIMRIKIPRDQIASVLESTPVLAAKVSATPADNQVKFVKLCIVIQTDVTGAEIFEPVESLSCNPLKEKSFAFDLSQIKTKSIPSFPDLVKKYSEGTGSMLVITVIQQSPKGETSKVTYDDIRFEAKN